MYSFFKIICVISLFVSLGFSQENMLTNGDFESPNGENDWIIGGTNGDITIAEHNGDIDARYDPENGGNKWDLQLFQYVEVTEGKTYDFSFDARSTGGTTRSIDVVVEYFEEPYTKHHVEAFQLVEGWEPFSGSFTAVATQKVKISFMDATDGTRCYFDNVVLSLRQKPILDVTYLNDGHGTIAGVIRVARGYGIWIDFTANEGYKFDHFELVSGEGTVDGMWVKNPQSDITVKGYFVPMTGGSITYNVSGNGTFEGPTSYNSGTPFLVFTVPEDGYLQARPIPTSGHITSRTCSYPNNTARCVVTPFGGDVTFALDFIAYSSTVSYSNDGNGTISGPGTTSYPESVEIEYAPNEGYELDYIEIVGGTATITGNILTEVITAVTLRGVFREITSNVHSVSYTVGQYGAIYGPDIIDHLETIEIENHSIERYELDRIEIVSGIGTITGNRLFNVQSAVTLRGVFREIPPETNLIIDWRDGAKYKTVRINGVNWMAENLNFVSPTGVQCYNDLESICDVAGRLYSWNAAMSACPEQWHLPSKNDWDDMVSYVVDHNAPSPGRELKSSYGWLDGGNGFDLNAFAALPAGISEGPNSYYGAGRNGHWWTSTAEHSDRKTAITFISTDHSYVREPRWSGHGMSVRCIQDPITPLP